MKTPIRYCAIYTRKSTDERLDMEFNSLDAQREACLSYIASQKSEGWVAVPDAYDDGGFSGGNMERPALSRLLEDIKAGRIQTVLVYKIDRLTRSLMDFAKLVEVFDAHGVTFVSVTQSFNTTTSMGRLTLNVLLSFAQFEREVAGERIRDKIAASKQKGMWTGGTVPLGYDVDDRKLVVNPEEAERVCYIFRRYLELGSVNDLFNDLNRQGIKAKPRKLKENTLRCAPFCASAVYYLLTNPVYIGKVRHKKKIYDGQHEPIIPLELWQKVQDRLMQQSATMRSQKKHRQKNLLRGLLVDSNGRSYIPTYTNKPGKQYRYYQLKNPESKIDDALYRLPAHEIETRVEKSIRGQLSDFSKVTSFLNLDATHQADIIHGIVKIQGTLDVRDIIEAVEKITVERDHITIRVKTEVLASLLSEESGIKIPAPYEDAKEIKAGYVSRRVHRGAIMIEPEKSQSGIPFDLPSDQLKNLVRGVIWREEHFQGMTLKQIADKENVSDGYVGQVIFKSFDLLLSEIAQ